MRAKRGLAIVGLVAFIALLISGCGGGDEHKGQYCARSHSESYMYPMIYVVGKIPVTTYIPETRTVCDEWLPTTPSTPSASST